MRMDTIEFGIYTRSLSEIVLSVVGLSVAMLTLGAFSNNILFNYGDAFYYSVVVSGASLYLFVVHGFRDIISGQFQKVLQFHGNVFKVLSVLSFVFGSFFLVSMLMQELYITDGQATVSFVGYITTMVITGIALAFLSEPENSGTPY